MGRGAHGTHGTHETKAAVAEGGRKVAGGRPRARASCGALGFIVVLWWPASCVSTAKTNPVRRLHCGYHYHCHSCCCCLCLISKGIFVLAVAAPVPVSVPVPVPVLLFFVPYPYHNQEYTTPLHSHSCPQIQVKYMQCPHIPHPTPLIPTPLMPTLIPVIHAFQISHYPLRHRHTNTHSTSHGIVSK